MLEHFFREGNLLALRELALRTVAERVDESLEEYIDQHRIEGHWQTEDRVLVCVAPTALASVLVQRGSRFAHRFGGSFWTLHVHTPDRRHTPEECAQLEEAFELSRNLGGKVIEIVGQSAADEILRVAAELRATRILLGQQRRSRLRELIGGSLTASVARSARGLDVLIVADPAHS